MQPEQQALDTRQLFGQVLGLLLVALELQVAAFDRAVDRFTAEVWTPVAGREPGMPRLLALIDRWLAYHRRRSLPGGCFVTTATIEFDARPGPLRDAVAEARRRMHRAVANDVRTAVEGADVIVTGTHARGWIVDEAWVKPGAHLAALGADLAGEQELHPGLLQRGRVFVDDIRQCREDGEINVPLREGLLAEEDVAGEIGKVVCGELEGRQSDEQITVFDSTGIALQDSATVPLEYERAVAAGVGVEKKMIST